MLRLVLSTKCSGINQKEFLEFAKETGFDGIDYASNIQDLWLLPKDIIHQSAKNNFPVLTLHQPIPLVLNTPSFLFERMLKLAASLNVRVLNLHLSAFINPLKHDIGGIKKFLKQAQAKNISLSFESNSMTPPFMIFPRQTYNAHFFGEFCVQHNLPITLDVSHIAQNNYDVVSFLKNYHHKIRMIHLSDFNGLSQHLSLGEGNLPLKNLLLEVKKTSSVEFVVFEIHNFLKKSTKKEKLRMIKTSFEFVNKLTK